MKSRKRRKTADPTSSAEETGDGIVIRPCHGIEEFEACIRVERAVWKSSDIDVVPIPLFVVASETGGQVLGAFHGSGSRGIYPRHCRLARPQAVSSFPHDSRPGRVQGLRHRPAIEAISERRCPRARNQPRRVDFRSFDNEECLLQFHAAGRDCPALSAERVRNYHQSFAWLASHGPPRRRMASPV